MEFQQAFVLHARPYRESSQLVEIFCESTGRLTLIANGSRRPRSPFKALLQPFISLQLTWRGAGELKTLDKVESLAPPPKLQERNLYSALYLNELLYYLLEPHTDYRELFDYYRQTLSVLATGGHPEPVLRQFELLLLEALGYGIDFRFDADSGEAVQPDACYHYLGESGFTRVEQPVAGTTFFSGRELLAMADGYFDEPTLLQAAKRFCRLALQPYLGNRPLKSRELFQQLSARSKW